MTGHFIDSYVWENGQPVTGKQCFSMCLQRILWKSSILEGNSFTFTNLGEHHASTEASIVQKKSKFTPSVPDYHSIIFPCHGALLPFLVLSIWRQLSGSVSF